MRTAWRTAIYDHLKQNYILDTNRKVTYATRHRFSLCSLTFLFCNERKAIQEEVSVNFCDFVRRCVVALLLVFVVSLPGYGQLRMPGKKEIGRASCRER